jgi:hypothetical protein
MMYEDDRRLIAILQEIMSEPLDLPTVQKSTGLAGCCESSQPRPSGFRSP